ncbi:hypothetical protein DESPIG_01005 [Desulfovibrio piger ATCC 29098]|uniref:Lipoprotein n=1 Tax=Desulfovibrio piger ATCC 29098 TaxID=411464 RepID=B6WSL5_9BACT|nr:hypothetical protein DESPIG_01005 [Desulfovibrio piger ATCC 29098]
MRRVFYGSFVILSFACCACRQVTSSPTCHAHSSTTGWHGAPGKACDAL